MGLQIEEEAILQKKPQIEEEAILEAHNTIGITLSLEIGKTLRKTSRVIIVVVQTTMKEIVGRKRGTRKSGTTNNKKNDSTTAACDGDIILACNDACASLASQETDWIIDS